MSNIEFVNDAYAEDGLCLPMIHFKGDEKKDKRHMCNIYSWDVPNDN